MWHHLRQRFYPSSESLYLFVVHQKHALQQGDSIIHEFDVYAIWRQLDSLSMLLARVAGLKGGHSVMTDNSVVVLWSILNLVLQK
jgi:hypothetical protein